MLGGAVADREYEAASSSTIDRRGRRQAPVVRQERLLDPAARPAAPRRDDRGARRRSMRIAIDEVFSGGLYSGCVHRRGSRWSARRRAPASVQGVYDWLSSGTGKKASAEQREQVIALFDEIDVEFGDRDGLRQLCGLGG
ncbi:MAG: hypothetical protein R3F59_22600 [Myxococcota bacterium]